MDNIVSKNFSIYVFLLTGLVALIGMPRESQAQSSYELLPAPDIWYNSVDGVRVGGRLRGQMAGSFGDGPHRLNMGVWIGTKFPEDPVSYYLSFIEPIPAISDFGSEASIQLITSYRTGFQSHGLKFNKRWQNGFDEKNYIEMSVGFRSEHRFDDDYLLYPYLWQDEWLNIISMDYVMTNTGLGDRYKLSFSTDINAGGSYDSFVRSAISLENRIALSENFIAHGRLYSGFASQNTAPEYLFMRGVRSARKWMDSGLTRARGTIPPSWMESGVFQVTGGANLRGYVDQDIQQLNNFGTPLYSSLSAFNMEMDYPNPIDSAIDKIPILGEFVDLRSYLFFDAGTSIGLTKIEENRTLADAGLGFLFSINIPDYLGKPRGLKIRYDIPLWLSHPGEENHFEYRNLIGVGAIIAL